MHHGRAGARSVAEPDFADRGWRAFPTLDCLDHRALQSRRFLADSAGRRDSRQRSCGSLVLRWRKTSARPREKIFTRTVLAVAVIGGGRGACVFLGITGMRIARTAGETPSQKADAIVIFGAAEYVGRPSPVYRARLDHGFELFEKGMAPVVITTGGAGQDPDFSEGGVGAGLPAAARDSRAGPDCRDPEFGYGAIGGAGRQYHACEPHAHLHRGERCVSRVSHPGPAGA